MNTKETQFCNAENSSVFYFNKRNDWLIFVRAGDVLPDWLDQLLDVDVFVSLYKRPHGFSVPFKGFCGASTGGLSKFHSFKKIAESIPEILDYSYVMLVDADIEVKAVDVMEAFRRGQESKLDLFQMALTSDSYTAYPFLYEIKGQGLQRTNFVEVMAPYMSKRLLRKVIPTFDQSISTWGLDYVWPNLFPAARSGVFHSLLMRHEEFPDADQGPFYKYLSGLGVIPAEEMRLIRRKFVSWAYYPHAGASWKFSWIGALLWRPIEWALRRHRKRKIKRIIRERMRPEY